MVNEGINGERETRFVDDRSTHDTTERVRISGIDKNNILVHAHKSKQTKKEVADPRIINRQRLIKSDFFFQTLHSLSIILFLLFPPYSALNRVMETPFLPIIRYPLD